MPFDPYALCPGGRDKKIRFCCPDMVKEIEQVGRLLESNQTGACLAYIDTLEKSHPDCACLTSAKLSVYRLENRWQEALPVAEQFHAREPDNPTASAEYAIALIRNGEAKRAVSTLVDAFERTKADTVHSTLLHAALQVGAYLLMGNVGLTAIAIGHVLKEIPATAEQANALLYKASSDADVPILMRDWTFDFECPDNFPGKETYHEAGILVRLMRWKQALALLEPLTQHADVWPGIWRNIGTIRLWLSDGEEGYEALKTYASLPNTPLEDAVDAETLRLLLNPGLLGDQTELLSIEYTLSDDGKALEQLLSHPLFYHLPTDHWKMSPPPRGGFVALDRPLPDSETALTPENIPRHLAAAFLLGKETDKEARLAVIAFPAYEQEMLESKLRDALGDLVQFPGNMGETIPVSQTRILSDSHFFIPSERRPDAETSKELALHYDTVLFPEAWISLPLGLLDGNTPGEAAKEPKYRIPLLASIQMIEFMMDYDDGNNAVQTLRSRLGLPMPETITVTESPGDDPLSVLDAYPVWRWYRFDVSKLSTDVLAGGLQIVMGMREIRASVRFAEELLNRPMDSMPFPVRVMAFEALIAASQEKEDIEQALLWLDRAKNESIAQNVPDAAWYLHEMTLHLMNNDGLAASEAMRYLMTHYRDDETVMGALQELLVQLGFFNPDGTPSAALARAQMQAESQPAAPKLWVPD